MLLKHAKNILNEFVGQLIAGGLHSANALATGGPAGLASYGTTVAANKIAEVANRRKQARMELIQKQQEFERRKINPDAVGPNNSTMNA